MSYVFTIISTWSRKVWSMIIWTSTSFWSSWSYTGASNNIFLIFLALHDLGIKLNWALSCNRHSLHITRSIQPTFPIFTTIKAEVLFRQKKNSFVHSSLFNMLHPNIKNKIYVPFQWENWWTYWNGNDIMVFIYACFNFQMSKEGDD